MERKFPLFLYFQIKQITGSLSRISTFRELLRSSYERSLQSSSMFLS